MSDGREKLPRARSDEIIVERLSDETLVYDLDRDEAHCLNGSAAVVWACCDGETTVSEAAARLEEEVKGGELEALEEGAAEDAVWIALDLLSRARLLEPGTGGVPVPPESFSRREALTALAGAAGAILAAPVVDSITAPLAAQAATCITAADCMSQTPPFCGGLPICGDPSRCCQVAGIQCRPLPC